MYEHRIEKMRAEGLLTDAQADALQASLSPHAYGDGRPPPRRASRLVSVIALACIAAACLLIALAIFIPPPGSSAGGEIQSVAETLNSPGGTGAMNRTVSTLTSAAMLLVPLVLVIGAFAWFYNRIVDKEERVYEAWAQVESNLQRRTDLIPNLVEAISRYMRHERETLTDITDERTDGLNPLADAMDRLLAEQQRAAEQDGAAPDDADALARLAETQRAVGLSLRNLVAVAESYPNLRSGDQFLSLQAQLEGTENRINVARMQFNESVGDYNSAIRRLPGTLIAGLGDFRRKGYFAAEDGAEAGAEVEFDRAGVAP